MTRRAVVVLRPRPGADATAARATGMGLDTVVAPIFRYAAVPWQPPVAGHDALMLTSAAAARLGGPGLARYHGLPLFAVGSATAAAARAAGFRDVRAGQADAAALLGQIAAAGFARVLHLAGRDFRAVDLPGLRIDRQIVYAADPVDGLAPAAVGVLQSGAIALVHSPRAAAHFAGLAARAGLAPAAIAIAAISPAAAQAAGAGWAAIAIADTPSDAGILAAAARLCDQAE